MNAEFDFVSFFLGSGAGALSAILLILLAKNAVKVLKWATKKGSPAPQVVDENTAVRCGACMSFIQSKPVFVNVASPKSFKVYRCEQCSTEVSIEF